jgi:hypothetical protein
VRSVKTIVTLASVPALASSVLAAGSSYNIAADICIRILIKRSDGQTDGILTSHHLLLGNTRIRGSWSKNRSPFRPDHWP